MRCAGILMPIQSLPGSLGIGDFGKEAYEFVDMMRQAKIKIWQILPLNPLGYGNSPYQPYSSYAGDEIYISIEKLCKDGMIHGEIPSWKPSSKIAYQAVREEKEKYLKQAYESFVPDRAYETFTKIEWVYPYSVFLTLKKQNNLVCWNEWPLSQRDWIKDKKYDLSHLTKEIGYEQFIQYIFYCQWMQLKEYANQNGIQIMGDIPFYVGIDSLDVWGNQECFLLDKDNLPTYIAGVPPDYFSATGQRWGNPIYDWDNLEKTKFDFWIKRMDYSSKLYDILRIDHFRAFDTYWKIPSDCPTAIVGEWVEAPGYGVFDTLQKELPDIKIVVEDLGELRKEVLTLRDHYQFKGMKVVQFTFDPDESNNDFEDRENMIVYTGTHDNDTVGGWYSSMSKHTQNQVRKYFKKKGYDPKNIQHSFIRYAFDSIGEIAIIPVQDVLSLYGSTRMNTPGTVGSPNWEWKLSNFESLHKQISFLKKEVKRSGRCSGQTDF